MSRHMTREKRKAPAEERRRSARTLAQIEVEYATVDELFTEFTRNINEGGVFVTTERPLELDEAVQLSFQLPGAADSIRATGRVVRIQTKEEHGVAGMGIEFDQLDNAAREAIDRLVRSLRRENR
jgi:uncharacterized protein (TIGR02266 family)